MILKKKKIKKIQMRFSKILRFIMWTKRKSQNLLFVLTSNSCASIKIADKERDVAAHDWLAPDNKLGFLEILGLLGFLGLSRLLGLLGLLELLGLYGLLGLLELLELLGLSGLLGLLELLESLELLGLS